MRILIGVGIGEGAGRVIEGEEHYKFPESKFKQNWGKKSKIFIR